MPKLAVIAFPGNNCEIETQRAAMRNGFESTIIRWNQPELVKDFDAYILPGGFSFEDRGRSGAISAREDIFDALKKETKKGKIILGICNGAQMVVESGLIPVKNAPLPFALAHNIRHDKNGHVLGTGFYNSWVNLIPKRRDTAFTNSIEGVLRVPIAHGEGRFTSVNEDALKALENGKHVAFRYSDSEGNTSSQFPINPNGSVFATAGMVNKEGTVCAMMPHPERFFDGFDGDQIFISMRKWIESKRSPQSVQIGDFASLSVTHIEEFRYDEEALYIEKKLIITDNEAYSISTTASRVCKENVNLHKSVMFEIVGDVDFGGLINSGLILNPNKEMLVRDEKKTIKKLGILDFHNDEADHLADRLSGMFNGKFGVKIIKVWDFGNTSQKNVNKVLQNRLLANPNSADIFVMK